MPRPTLILGGPGCGKTTALLNIVEEAFDRGVEPNRIAYVAFTRKAAQEARDRMSTRFAVSPDDIPFFRTLHSLAFKMLDIKADAILSADKFTDFSKAEHLRYSEEMLDEFGSIITQASTYDERVLAAIALSRLMRCDLIDLDLDPDIDLEYAEHLRQEIEEFKADAILVDYTDLLEDFVTRGHVPDLDLLIVDEAQDLSKLQWEMVEKLARGAKEVYYAGDDDQAIFMWAGADLPYFLSIDGERCVLPTSYRLKGRIFDACQAIISDVVERYPKDWEPHSPGGSVDLVHDLEDLDFSEGTWFLLARDSRKVRQFEWFLRREGWPHLAKRKSGFEASTSGDHVRAVLGWEKLRKGGEITGVDTRTVWEFLHPTMRGDMREFDPEAHYSIEHLEQIGLTTRGTWLEALVIPQTVADHISAVKMRGESLLKTPRITCSTIHGVKGGEADHVVVAADLPPRVFAAYQNNGDAERRVLFTAASRAKERLLFITPRTARHYDVEDLLD